MTTATIERCPNCGIPVGPMPEDAANDEMFCNSCYEVFEQEQGQAMAKSTNQQPTPRPDGLQFAPVTEEMLTESDANIRVTRHELLRLMLAADRVLDQTVETCDKTEEGLFAALYETREALGAFLEEPERRV